MKYVSTRGEAPELAFDDVLLAGLARDGGLYVPSEWPQFSAEDIAAMAGHDYAGIAYRVIRPFVAGTIPDDDLEEMVRETYAGFGHDAVAPLKQIGANHWLLELFHGPTLAFKDLALQLVGRMFDFVLSARGDRVTIVGATSGDTGSAAIEACRDRDNVDIYILFPVGRVSPVQQRQMTTVNSPNVHALAVDGTFDDCQDLVKAMFADVAFRDQVRLSAVNSINWARIAAQMVYYATAQAALAQPIRFVVPSGNMGDALAGYVAARCGLLTGGLEIVCAVNENDSLYRVFSSGVMSKAPAVATPSPAMDISIPSNFERLLFEMSGRDSDLVRNLYGQFAQSGEAALPDAVKSRLGCSGLKAATVSNADTLEEMCRVERETGWLICPHTAVGTHVARSLPEADVATVVLATASPAKFPETVQEATGRDAPLPDRVQGLRDRGEVFERTEPTLAAVRQRVEDITG